MKVQCKAIKQDGTVCGHKWLPRVEGDPVMCPACKSRKWKGGSHDKKKSS